MIPTEHKSFVAAREAPTAATNAANLPADAKVAATVIGTAALDVLGREVARRQETERTSPVGGDLSLHLWRSVGANRARVDLTQP